MTVLRWGICSAGKISQDFSTAVSLLDNHTIQAIAARSQEDAQHLANKVGAETAYKGYESLAADSKVDIIYIGSINTQHFPLCKLFLNAKKHVLCEKPLGMNAKEVSSMIVVAKKSGCFFMEAIWSRFLPSFEKVRSLIAAGDIGDIKFISGDFCFDGADQRRVNDKDIGGGAIYDIGIYLIQLVTMVFGPDPISVQGVGGLTESGVDEICSMTLKYPGHKVANLLTSIRAFSNNEANIVGTKGRIRLLEGFHVASRVELIRGYPAPGMFEKQVFECPLPETDKEFFYINSIGLQYEANAVKQAIEEGKTEHPLLPWSESLAICKIMDKLRHDVGYYTAEEEEEEEAK